MDNLFSMLFNQLDGQNMAQMQEMMDNIQLNSSSSPSTTAADRSELKKQEKDFEQELALAKESEEYNRRTPIPCPLIDRATLLFSFNMRLSEMKKTPGKGQFRTRKTWITGKAPCCNKPLTELNPIHLAEMKVPFVHEGHFLACRVLTESIVVVGTEVLIEDTQRRVHGISFYNFNADLNNSTWLKPGTIVLIKEPYMKYSSIAKMPFLRVDSPSDVVFVHKTNHELLEWAGALCWFEPEALSAEELKKRGNAAFGREDFEEALDHYQRALALIGQRDEMAPVLHLNMAAALLELKRFPETVEEAKKALDGGANKEKAFYRLGCAAYGMRRWSEAIGHFESALEVNPELSLTADKLAKAKARLAESLTGKYDLKKLLDDEKRGQRFMDVADYCGPIKVADIPGKGKGLIVTEDVPKGTLLLAEKAYAIAFDNFDDFSLRTLCSVNLVTKEANMSSNALCIIEAIQKLKREPQTANQLYGLYAGKETSNIPTMEGIIDTGRIERICSLNCFNPRDDRKVVNTQPTFFGDLLMIRALIDFKKGDEVTVNYLSSLKTYEERHQGCTKKWGFQCECRLCELECQEPPALAKERQKLAEKFAEEVKKQRKLKWSKPDAALAKLLSLANAIRQTYRNRNELRTQMVGPLSILSYVYFQLNEPEKALEASKGILDSLGPQLMYSFVPVAYARMAEIYALRMRNHKMAKNTALKAYQMVQHKFGPMDKKLFLQMYPEFVPFM